MNSSASRHILNEANSNSVPRRYSISNYDELILIQRLDLSDRIFKA
jgi:2C-methyl-D-erythritol 2,4-cyclodiphosphate synthase